MADGFDGFWYRCEVKHYSVADEWGDHSYTSTEVQWSKFAVVAETPKGVWLRWAPPFSTNPDYARCAKGRRGDDTLVLGKARRQFACPTRETALADAIVRKERHIAGCKARLAAAERDLDLLRMEGLKNG